MRAQLKKDERGEKEEEHKEAMVENIDVRTLYYVHFTVQTIYCIAGKLSCGVYFRIFSRPSWDHENYICEFFLPID